MHAEAFGQVQLAESERGDNLLAMQKKYKKANQIQKILLHKIEIIITITAIISSTAKGIMVNRISSITLSTRMSHGWSMMSGNFCLMMIRAPLWKFKKGKRLHMEIRTLRILLKHQLKYTDQLQAQYQIC